MYHVKAFLLQFDSIPAIITEVHVVAYQLTY